MNFTVPATTSKYGVLDIGSNSVRLVIYEVCGVSFTPIYNEKVLAGLGRRLRETGCLSVSGREKALAALARFKSIADAQGVEKLVIGATAALRVAKDARSFIDEACAQTGLIIEPISGEKEAYLSAMGVLSAAPKASGLVADLGGASLEIISVADRIIDKGQTFPLGPFQMMGAESPFEGVNASDLKARINESLNAGFKDNPPAKGQRLYLVGGAWRNLAAIHQKRSGYPLRILQGYELNVSDTRELTHWACGEGLAEIEQWPGISRRRLETLPYGAVLLGALLDYLEPSDIIISEAGLREGLIFDVIGTEGRWREALHDGCFALAQGNLQSDEFFEPLFSFLSHKCDFPQYFSAETETRLRKAACLLAGMGKGLHTKYRASLVFRDVLYAPLADLSHIERAYLALIIYRSSTHSVSTPNDKAMTLLLPPEAQKCADIYGTAIRLAIVASGLSGELLRQISLSQTNNSYTLSTTPEFTHLITERVTQRLDKLNALFIEPDSDGPEVLS